MYVRNKMESKVLSLNIAYKEPSLKVLASNCGCAHVPVCVCAPVHACV